MIAQLHYYTDDQLTTQIVQYLNNASIAELSELYHNFFNEMIPEECNEYFLEEYLNRIIKFLDYDYDREMYWIAHLMKYAFGEHYEDYNIETDVYVFKSID